MSNICKEIRVFFENNSETEYRAFSAKLIPNIDSKTIAGVRIPTIRKLAKDLAKRDDINLFLEDLPHKYHEENVLHIILINKIKDFDKSIKAIDSFLPYITNWAVSDTLSPKCFSKNISKLKTHANRWIESKKDYHIRVGVLLYMKYCLEEGFDKSDLCLIANINSDEYYVNMMRAWYFATALAFQYDHTIKIIESKKLDTFTHNKSIQKAIESFRVTDEHKAYLKTLRIK